MLRTLAVVLLAATVPTIAIGQTANSPTPAPAAGAKTENTAPTGKTKPPGAALPAGHSRLDSVEEKSKQVDRKAQQSICKC